MATSSRHLIRFTIFALLPMAFTGCGGCQKDKVANAKALVESQFPGVPVTYERTDGGGPLNNKTYIFSAGGAQICVSDDDTPAVIKINGPVPLGLVPSETMDDARKILNTTS